MLTAAEKSKINDEKIMPLAEKLRDLAIKYEINIAIVTDIHDQDKGTHCIEAMKGIDTETNGESMHLIAVDALCECPPEFSIAVIKAAEELLAARKATSDVIAKVMGE